jgi:hypothetical protein
VAIWLPGMPACRLQHTRSLIKLIGLNIASPITDDHAYFGICCE